VEKRIPISSLALAVKRRVTRDSIVKEKEEGEPTLWCKKRNRIKLRGFEESIFQNREDGWPTEGAPWAMPRRGVHAGQRSLAGGVHLLKNSKERDEKGGGNAISGQRIWNGPWERFHFRGVDERGRGGGGRGKGGRKNFLLLRGGGTETQKVTSQFRIDRGAFPW